jgi:GGDEF domain-containing protein
MSINEAKKYISELHRKQKNPYLWPNFLTGLPDVGAIINKINEVYPKLSRYSISYIRIANIHPYLIKYGSGRHSEIIQWAAAILKTTADKHGAFVGAFGTHNFVAICKKKDAAEILSEASKTFQKKAKTFYSKEDIKKKTPLSFTREGRRINIGFMQFIASTIEGESEIPKENLLQHLGAICTELERAHT